MSIKIEKYAVKRYARPRSNLGNWGEFVQAVYALKVGESFLFPAIQSNHRIALSLAKDWLQRVFVCRREGKGFRVGRIE